jgi:cell wall-associated NlpC family hydrolase
MRKDPMAELGQVLAVMGSMQQMQGQSQRMQQESQMTPVALQGEWLKNQQAQMQMQQQQEEAPFRELMNAVAAHRAMTSSYVDGREMSRPVTETPGMQEFLQAHPLDALGLNEKMYPTVSDQEIYQALMSKMTGQGIDPALAERMQQSGNPYARLLLEHGKR